MSRRDEDDGWDGMDDNMDDNFDGIHGGSLYTLHPTPYTLTP